MPSTPIHIHSNCVGSFIVDSDGVRSKERIPLKETHWDQNVFKITCDGNVITSSGNIRIDGNVIRSGGDIYINGKALNEKDKFPGKLLNETWSHYGKKDVVLEELILDHVGNFDVDIPLHRTCNIASSGVGSISINGDNPNSQLSVRTSAIGKISGNGTLETLRLRLTGIGDVSGFTVLKKLVINSSGIGNISLRHTRNCVISKFQSGIGKINLKQI